MSTGEWGREGESGLLDDFNFTVESARFTRDARYNEGKSIVLLWEGTTDVPDTPEYSMFVTVGNDWDSPDGGKSIGRTDGKDKFFNNSTVYYKIIDRCRKEFGIEELLSKRGSPYIAAVWEGLTFHMKMQSYTFNKEARERLMPVAFMGARGETVAAAASATAAAPAVPSDNGATATTATSPATATKILDVKIRAIAKKAPSYSEFQDEALAIDGVLDDDELMTKILDEGPAGFWAETHANA